MPPCWKLQVGTVAILKLWSRTLGVWIYALPSWKSKAFIVIHVTLLRLHCDEFICVIYWPGKKSSRLGLLDALRRLMVTWNARRFQRVLDLIQHARWLFPPSFVYCCRYFNKLFKILSCGTLLRICIAFSDCLYSMWCKLER